MGGGKSLNKEQYDTNSRVWSSYDVYMYPQRVNIPLQGLDRHALTVGAISAPQPNWSPPLVTFHQSWIYIIQKNKKHSEKADQSTLPSGSSEHAVI